MASINREFFYCVLYGTQKRVIAVEIVLLSCILAEIGVIILFQPPSWIYDFRFYLGVLLIAPLKVGPQKHGGGGWNVVPS